MKFSVYWNMKAIAEFERVSAAHPAPEVVRQESTWFDYSLRRIPGDLGESRAGNARLWFGDHLGAYFTVDDNTLRVQILAVGPARRG